MRRAIVVLAAGLGTRYGGSKQLAPLGPAGEAIFDYTLRDAAAAGFSHAVLVVAHDMVDAMTTHLDEFVPPIPVQLVIQGTPRGTAHATATGAAGLTDPFAVANADDVYGADAIATLAARLRSRPAGEPARTGAVVAYRADATLSDSGGVSRAVCVVDGRGRLVAIAEHTGVRRENGRIISDSGPLDAATPVSMNLWGFDPSFLELLQPAVDRFVVEHHADDHELRLPDLVGELVARGELHIDVLATTSPWFGITYPEDAPRVRERLAVVGIAAMFVTRSAPVTATPVVHGHIHDTYIVTGDDGERLVVQRLNRAVFCDLDALASNAERVTGALRRAAAARREQPIVAEPIATRAGGWLHVDHTGEAWRATRYIEGTRVLGSDATTAELRAAARAFAGLTRDLEGVGPLAETIPRFHDLPSRRADLAAAVAADRAGRATESRDLIADATRIGERVERELGLAGAEHLPRRVVHNDAKLDNVLVDTETGAVAGIVDLDTVMYGTVLNDFGELARTAASRGAEDEPDLTKVVLELDRFTALAEGYLTGLGTDLLDSERRALALAGPLLTLENAVRFLTDHLNGDVYFRVHRAGQNAQRARAQLRLAGQMVDRLDELRGAIAAAAPQPS